MTVYEILHPNGIIHVTEAPTPQAARTIVLAHLHRDVGCLPNELIVTEQAPPPEES